MPRNEAPAHRRNSPKHQHYSPQKWIDQRNRQILWIRNNWIKVQSQTATISTTADYVLDMEPICARHLLMARRR